MLYMGLLQLYGGEVGQPLKFGTSNGEEGMGTRRHRAQCVCLPSASASDLFPSNSSVEVKGEAEGGHEGTAGLSQRCGNATPGPLVCQGRDRPFWCVREEIAEKQC